MMIKFMTKQKTHRSRQTAPLSLLVSAAAVVAVLTTPVMAAQSTNKESAITRVSYSPGIELLKAKNHASGRDLNSFDALRMFFNAVQNDDAHILKRANRLLQAMAGDDDEESARRISAAASLTMESGRAAKVRIAEEYRLPPGAIGWDFGNEDGQLHPGFNLVTPPDLSGPFASANVAVNGSALADGVAGLTTFKGDLENGVYRILIVQPRIAKQTATPKDKGSPFGSHININGAEIETRPVVVASEVTNLTNGGKSKPTLTQGVQTWAVVSNGRLSLDFPDMPLGVAISAIIAEPVNVSNMPLDPDVYDAMLDALSDLNPASGPETRSGRRNVGAFSSAPTSAPTTSPRRGSTQRTPARNTATRARFTAPRTRLAAATPAAASSSPTNTTSPIAPGPTTTATTDPIPFEDRQILVKRSLSDGDDTMGRILDIADLFGPDGLDALFDCETCSLTPNDSPDLSVIEAQIAALAGDWLNNPGSLDDVWSELQPISIAWPEDFERAIVYEFDIDVLQWVDVELRINAATGILVWLDGEFVFAASNPGAFVDSLDWPFILNLPDLDGGQHFLQVFLENHSGANGFALEIRGAPVFATVPEPNSVALMAFGMLVFGFVMRRRKQGA
jgi:hypothetical protein